MLKVILMGNFYIFPVIFTGLSLSWFVVSKNFLNLDNLSTLPNIAISHFYTDPLVFFLLHIIEEDFELKGIMGVSVFSDSCVANKGSNESSGQSFITSSGMSPFWFESTGGSWLLLL